MLARLGARGSLGAFDGAGEGDARRDVQLFEDMAQVSLDRLLAQEQLGGDLGVRATVDDEPRDLQLAFS